MQHDLVKAGNVDLHAGTCARRPTCVREGVCKSVRVCSVAVG